MFKRGGIYPVNLAHNGTGQQESCPCLVVSNNISNDNINDTINNEHGVSFEIIVEE